jgi:aminopeptidase N
MGGPPAVAAALALDPPQPTLRLPRNFLPTGYRARLAIDPASDGFTGAIEIEGELRERSQRIWLHGRKLSVASAKISQGARAVRVEVTAAGDELLSLRPVEPLDPGPYTLALDYRGSFDLHEGAGAYKRTFDDATYIATQFESTSARRVFPCFDEPDNKVPWQLTLDVPRALVAVTNTPPISEAALDDQTKRIVFAPTRPLPSYLLAFGVGPYQIVDAGKPRGGTPIRIVALQGRAKEAAWSVETTAKIVQLLEDYFGTRQVLALTFDPRLERREARQLLTADREPAQQQVADAFFRAHVAELQARFPDEGLGTANLFTSSFLRGCDAARRDDALAFVRAHFSKRFSAEGPIAVAVERIDRCIAARALLGPRLTAWLARPAR